MCFQRPLIFLTIENKMIMKLAFVYHEASEVLLTTPLAFSPRKERLAPEPLSLWYLLLLRLCGKHTCVPCHALTLHALKSRGCVVAHAWNPSPF